MRIKMLLILLWLFPLLSAAQPADTAWVGRASQGWMQEARRAKVAVPRAGLLDLRSIRRAVLSKVDPQARLRLWQQDLRTGVGLYEAGRWAEAARWFEELEEAYAPYLEPRDDVLYFAAESWLRFGQLDKAGALYERLLRDPDSPYAAAAGFRLLRILPDSVSWSRRLELLAYMPATDSLTYRARLLLARWAMERGRFQEARAVLPPGPEGDFLRAWMLEEEGDTASARRAYEALLGSPLRARALWRLGILEAERGDSARAMARWTPLLRQLSGSEAVMLALRMGLTARARILIDNALAELPSDPLDRAEILRDLAPALLAVVEQVPLSPMQREAWLKAIEHPGPLQGMSALELEAARALLLGDVSLRQAPGYRFYRYAERARQAKMEHGLRAALAVWAEALRDSLPQEVRKAALGEVVALWAQMPDANPEAVLRWAPEAGLEPVELLIQIAERLPDGSAFYQAALRLQPDHPRAPALAWGWIRRLQERRHRLHPERQAPQWMETTTRLALLTEAFWRAYGPPGTHPASGDPRVRAWAREALSLHVGYATVLADLLRHNNPAEAARWIERAIYYTATLAFEADSISRWGELLPALEEAISLLGAGASAWRSWLGAVRLLEDPFPSPAIPLDVIPDSLRAPVEEAIVFAETERADLAASRWAQAARLGLPRAGYEAARWFYRMGRADSALACLVPLPEVEGGNLWQSSAWLLKGLAWMQVGELDSAEAVLERFAQAYPNDPRTGWALWELAQGLARRGLRDRAVVQLEWIVRNGISRAPIPLPHEVRAARELLRYRLDQFWEATEGASQAPEKAIEALYAQIRNLASGLAALELEDVEPLVLRAELRWAHYTYRHRGQRYDPAQVEKLEQGAIRLLRREPEYDSWARNAVAWLWVGLADQASRPADRARWIQRARAILGPSGYVDSELQQAISRLVGMQ
jgi:hypothetical protein|nr:MAG: hypothetical protein KatS3mg041_0403 [Bacteroidota bacterium]